MNVDRGEEAREVVYQPGKEEKLAEKRRKLAA